LQRLHMETRLVQAGQSYASNEVLKHALCRLGKTMQAMKISNTPCAGWAKLCKQWRSQARLVQAGQSYVSNEDLKHTLCRLGKAMQAMKISVSFGRVQAAAPGDGLGYCVAHACPVLMKCPLACWQVCGLNSTIRFVSDLC
jgi:hypothetical protein